MKRVFSMLVVVAFLAVASCTRSAIPDPAEASMSDAETLRAIARDIAALKPRFPQLVDFSVDDCFDAANRTLSYSHKTHAPSPGPGWRSGVPEPDADGIWFVIDVHETSSTAQIHTQPVAPALALRDKRVLFLLLEGEKTAPLHGELHRILTSHGVVEGKL